MQVELNSTKNDKLKKKVVRDSLFVDQLLNQDSMSKLKVEKQINSSLPDKAHPNKEENKDLPL